MLPKGLLEAGCYSIAALHAACRCRDHDHMRVTLCRQFGMDALTIDPLVNGIHRLSVSVEVLAALRAALRLQRRDVGTDLRVRVCLQEVLRAPAYFERRAEK